ncbi:hypothetical protein Y032_0389g518 [Ancylostoma ceylanicum]|uniref:Uncharacterized protein n=1 Tax=Ancylostoma ceylanicum TaxID=53326 RepID=A0A016RT96_9BILA|nr:hypothetical protein Y032_0389g518 [Ancylostoma ceylanicum]
MVPSEPVQTRSEFTSEKNTMVAVHRNSHSVILHASRGGGNCWKCSLKCTEIMAGYEGRLVAMQPNVHITEIKLVEGAWFPCIPLLTRNSGIFRLVSMQPNVHTTENKF